jgi:protein-S-isoprenylcysteine O-methyltransferase Ste14
MPFIAMILFAVFLLVAGVLRAAVQVRRTGDTGNRRLGRRRTRLQRLVDGLGGGGAAATGLAGPVAALAGLDPVAVLHRPAVQAGGLVLAVVGIAATFAAQLALGASWRVGIDAGERTALVTSGVYGLVRNPIFTATAAMFAGLALMVPNVVSLAGLAAVVAGVELQVRLEEEPYLLSAHGPRYRRYAARTGRFLPGIGRRRG